MSVTLPTRLQTWLPSMHARDKTILLNCFVDDKMKLKLLLFIVSLVAVAVAVIAAVSFTIAFVCYWSGLSLLFFVLVFVVTC